jgi:hypothetical protein
MGVYIGQSTKIVDREVSEVTTAKSALFRRRRGHHAIQERHPTCIAP